MVSPAARELKLIWLLGSPSLIEDTCFVLIAYVSRPLTFLFICNVDMNKTRGERKEIERSLRRVCWRLNLSNVRGCNLCQTEKFIVKRRRRLNLAKFLDTRVFPRFVVAVQIKPNRQRRQWRFYACSYILTAPNGPVQTLSTYTERRAPEIRAWDKRRLLTEWAWSLWWLLLLFINIYSKLLTVWLN